MLNLTLPSPSPQVAKETITYLETVWAHHLTVFQFLVL